MTIVEAIKQVLRQHNMGLTHVRIYEEIVKQNLYQFGAKDPKAIVRSKLRQHCYGVNYPSASPTKHFISDDGKGRKALYRIWDKKESPPKPAVQKIDQSDIPEEIIDVQYKQHISNIKNQIMDSIYNADFGFFEKLVIKLLLKMGYGWDNEKSGIHTGGPNDNGIDGIIYQDQLGLDKVYIQAKKYSKNNKVTQSEIRNFIGAMNPEGAEKGVFITSSSFTQGAIEWANKARNMTLILIDSEKLSELLLKNGLGVSVAESYKIYKIDTDEFNDY